MRAMLPLLLAMCAVRAVATTPDPPDPAKLLKWYTIDMDQPAEQRWSEVTKDYKDFIVKVVQDVKAEVNANTAATLVAAIKKGLDSTVKDDEYAREMQGIAEQVGVTYDDIVTWNSYYELTNVRGTGSHERGVHRMCTSIIARNDNGSMYLGHNFDYPTHYGPGMINTRFVHSQSGATVWEGSVVAGTIGPMAGVVPGAFATAIDERLVRHPALSDAVKAAEAGAYGFVNLLRRSFEVATSYEEATKFYLQTPMIAPGYFIYGGVKGDQGAVVTANTSALNNDLWELKDAAKARGHGDWFLVETNYDHQGKAPFFDDRRDPAIKHLEAIGSASITTLGLWNILSTKPNFGVPPRSTTISTHLIDIQTGEYMTYLRHSTPP